MRDFSSRLCQCVFTEAWPTRQADYYLPRTAVHDRWGQNPLPVIPPPPVVTPPVAYTYLMKILTMNTFIHQSVVDKRQRNYVQQTIDYKLSK